MTHFWTFYEAIKFQKSESSNPNNPLTLPLHPYEREPRSGF
jgi:hypothetical protein